MEKAIQRCSFVVLVVFVCFAFISQGYAAINSWGDVQPPDPSMWTTDTGAYIGKDANGVISITEGSDVRARFATLGYESGVVGTAIVDGTGSSWICSENLCVGGRGQGILEINNGGYVHNGGGHIGCLSGSTGEVSVDGAGSSWICSRLYVGDKGQGTLEINDGGYVRNWGGYIGYFSGSTGEVSVDGAGSSLNCTGKYANLCVGYYGHGTLNISNGGNVSSGGGTIGYESGSAGEVSVDGVGSNWSCDRSLSVGTYGHGTLEITSGGKVSCESDGYIGEWSGSTGEVSVDGAGSRLRCEENLFVGLSGQGTLNISNGGYVRCNYSGRIGSGSGSTGGVSVDGEGSSLRCGADLYVGNQGQGTLEINNGGYVRCWYGYIGRYAGSTGEVSIDGEGSNWRCRADLYVGHYGQGTLEISNGGYVRCVADLYVGYYGQGTLEISNGGNVDVTGDTWVARFEGSTGQINFNNGTLTTGGLLATPADLMGTGVINTHGIVSDIDLLFDSIHGTNQTIILDSFPGQNITINLSQDLDNPLGAGYVSEGTLTIKDGISVESSSGYLGYKSGSVGQATVDGAGSSWSCSENLSVGYYGQGALEISNGGNVNVTGGTWVARFEGSTGQINFNNGTLATGGILAASADLTGTGAINTHGIVSDIDLLFDSIHGTNQTIILDSHPGQNITINLSQDSTGSLGAGYASEGTLTIKDGVSVESNYGYLGYKSGSLGQATVDGTGSSWSCSSNLSVGDSGRGTLEISNGGAVSCDGDGYIGRWSGSTGEVSVDGAGSSWNCTESLYVAFSGQGTLDITNGGNVSCDDGYIGYESGSSGEVSVDGAGSSWNCRGYYFGLYVGYKGQGTLEITKGGLVKVKKTLRIDYNGDGNSFIRMATGGMLALYGNADADNDDNITIEEFLTVVEGTDEIEYWNGAGWSNILNAMAGGDYFIEYHDEGDLAGYTVLTVTAVPEPATLLLLLFGVGIVGRKK